MHQRLNLLHALACTAILVGTTACETDELGSLTPSIAVSACDGGTVEVEGEIVGGVSDCAVAFGAVEVGAPRSYGIILVNPSNVTLRITGVELLTGSDPAFELVSFPTEVAAGSRVPVSVSFRPEVEAEVRATVRITSDADNTPETAIDVELVAVGIGAGSASVVVTPTTCDLGSRSLNSTTVCSVLVTATGDATILLDDVAIDGDGAFSLVSLAPDQVPPGTSATIGVTFTPTAVANYSGVLRFTTNDPAQPTLRVPLLGAGSDGPTCEVRISAVNGATTTGVPALEPLDDINLVVDSSDPSASVAWEFVTRPPGSTLSFVTPLGSSTGLIFDGSKYGIDAPGDYRVRATQTDANGQVGTCDLGFSAVPTDELLIQLTWTTAFGDVDLHLVKQDEQDRYCARSVEAGPLAQDCGAGVIEDCYYWSCKPFNSLRPDWDDDGEPGTGGDPSLDIDDRCGFGPEHINVDFPTSGRHLLGIDHFGHNGCPGAGPSDVTVRVYTYGVLTAEWFRTMNEGDWWEVAIIDWPATTGPVCIDDLAVDGDECP